MIDLGVEYNIIDKKGAWFSYKGQRLGQGRDTVRDELKKNDKLLEEIELAVMQVSKDRKTQAANGIKRIPAPTASLEEELVEV